MQKSRYTKRYQALLRALREARKAAGLTQLQVARKFGSHPSFVCKCETGERRVDAVELSEFCRLYGVSLAELAKRAGLD